MPNVVDVLECWPHAAAREIPVRAVLRGGDADQPRAAGDVLPAVEGARLQEDVRARAAAEWDELMLETGAALLASSARSRNITVNAESSDKPNSDDKLFVDDIRDYFGCGRTSAYKILKVLPSKKVGGRVFVYRRDLEAYMREHGGIYTGEKYKLQMLNER